jgi:hypothetical protein
MTSKAILMRPRRRLLVNAAMDAYLDWRDECVAVSEAYRRWADAGEADAAPAWRHMRPHSIARSTLQRFTRP